MPDTPNGRFTGPCYHCKSEMWLPADLYGAAKRSDKITFYCPYGHPQIFAKGEREIDVVRRERDLLKQQIAWKDDQIRAANSEKNRALQLASQSEAKRTKLVKRVTAGVCPCCHRSFVQLRRHMANKHPEKALQ